MPMMTLITIGIVKNTNDDTIHTSFVKNTNDTIETSDIRAVDNTKLPVILDIPMMPLTPLISINPKILY